MQIFEQDNLFSLTFYSNNGKNVTDGPIMEWDNKSKIFKRLVPDRSQW
jgi:hypothetical protein